MNIKKRIKELKSNGKIYFGQPFEKMEAVLAKEFEEFRQFSEKIVVEACLSLYGESVSDEYIKNYGEKAFVLAAIMRREGCLYSMETLMPYLKVCEVSGVLRYSLDKRSLKKSAKLARSNISYFDWLVLEKEMDPLEAAHALRYMGPLRRLEAALDKKLVYWDVVDILSYFLKSKLRLVDKKKIAVCRMLDMPWEDAEACAKNFKTLKETIAWACQVNSLAL